MAKSWNKGFGKAHGKSAAVSYWRILKALIKLVNVDGTSTDACGLSRRKDYQTKIAYEISLQGLISY